MKINIAIDGPSAAGKSTIARRLAEKLGYVHLDTGAMYRSTALKAMQMKISLEDEDAVCRMLADTKISLTPEGKVFLDEKDVTDEIRTAPVSRGASIVSQLKGVRAELVRRQKKMAEEGGFIMDGRDIGTVVLPDAQVKIFMTASPMARAKRRYDQNVQKHIPTGSVEEIAADIAARDEQDMNRTESPLRKAENAVEIDTSSLSIDEVTEKIYHLAEAYIKEGGK